MKEFPKLTILIAFIFAFISISFPLQIMNAYNHSFSEMTSVFSKLALINYMIMGISAINMCLVLRMSPWLKVFVPLQLVFVAWNNLIVGYAGLNTSMGVAQSSTFVFALFCSVFLFDPFKTLLSQPKKRWWLTSPREKMNLILVVNAPQGLSFRTNTFNLSKEGLFIEMDYSSLQEMYSLLSPGTVLELRIKISQVQTLPIRAVIVRHAQEEGEYPSGLGLQFTGMTSYQRRIITDLLEHRIMISSVA